MAELVTRGPLADRRAFRSLYLGGGTPSKLGGQGFADLVRRVEKFLGVDNVSTRGGSPEITIEVNPEDVTAEAVAAWVSAGVNRASVGVQSFDPNVLAWMHREHSGTQAEKAVELLRTGGIPSVSLDLIFALPEAVPRNWCADLERALALRPDHLSLYGLTVEPATPLGRWTARGAVHEAPEERFEAEFLEADRVLVSAGYEHYEVSNYGLPGHRAVHNSAYWSGVPYLGLGPAAHGFDGAFRRWNVRAYAAWLEAVRSGADPVEGSEGIGPDERVPEAVYLGLRTADGLSVCQSELEMVTSWVQSGWGMLHGQQFSLTPTGWLRLDAIAAALTSQRSRS